jgi:hypothetical protein
MIQRPQTIFLALVLVMVGALCLLPVYNITIVTDEGGFMTFRKLQHLKVLSLSIAIIPLLALITIFMYKNRKRQMLMAYLGMLLSLVLFVLCISMPELFSSSYLITMGTPVVDFNIGVFLIAIIPALFFFAVRNIKKDEKITKESDRLR